MSAISSFYHRRASIKSASKPITPTVMAYRTTSGEIQYTAFPEPSSTPHSTPQQSSLPIHTPNYDSDGEPLLPPSIRSHNYSELTEEERSRFTATGRPIPPPTLMNGRILNGGLQAWGGDMFTQPRFLPVQYTDDSIIPAIVTGVKPATKLPSSPEEGPKKRRHSLAKVFKGEKKVVEEDGKGKGITKVVFMPRREYLKWFAKDEKGEYIGSEPRKEWTEEELEEVFGQYRPKHAKRASSFSGRLG